RRDEAGAAGRAWSLVRRGRAVVLAGRRRDGRVRRRARKLHAAFCVVVRTTERVLELAHPLAERAAHLRQPLRAEHEQDDDQQDQQLPRRDPARHPQEDTSPVIRGNGAKMKKRLSEQVVVVTGASSGLGRAIARGAGDRGANVVVTARNAAALDDAVRRFKPSAAKRSQSPPTTPCRTGWRRASSRRSTASAASTP